MVRQHANASAPISPSGGALILRSQSKRDRDVLASHPPGILRQCSRRWSAIGRALLRQSLFRGGVLGRFAWRSAVNGAMWASDFAVWASISIRARLAGAAPLPRTSPTKATVPPTSAPSVGRQTRFAQTRRATDDRLRRRRHYRGRRAGSQQERGSHLTAHRTPLGRWSLCTGNVFGAEASPAWLPAIAMPAPGAAPLPCDRALTPHRPQE